MNQYNAVLFDLDGTLLDTAPDLLDAVNIVLAHHRKPALQMEDIRQFISIGSFNILSKSLELKHNDPRLNHMRHLLFQAYLPIMHRKSRLFTGIEPLIQWLDLSQFPWGIVTNKPAWVANPLVTGIPSLNNCAYLIGPETTGKSKPDPAGLLYAARLLKLPPQKILYVGDCEHDIRSAKNAGMDSIAVTWGYHLKKDKPPLQWHATHCVSTPTQLLTLLKNTLS